MVTKFPFMFILIKLSFVRLDRFMDNGKEGFMPSLRVWEVFFYGFKAGAVVWRNTVLGEAFLVGFGAVACVGVPPEVRVFFM